MVIVRFNQWPEFLEELKGSPPEEKSVRLTVSLRYNGRSSPYRTLVAGFLSRDGIVEYVQYLGADGNGKLEETAQALLDSRRAALNQLGFRVKSGRYHVPPSGR